MADMSTEQVPDDVEHKWAAAKKAADKEVPEYQFGTRDERQPAG
jgi:hypothetical protein